MTELMKIDAEQLKELLRQRKEEKRLMQEKDDKMFVVCLALQFDFCTKGERKAVYKVLRSAWNWGKGIDPAKKRKQ